MNSQLALSVPTYPMRPTAGGSKPRSLPGQWTYEPKYNGWRALVHIPTRAVFNRHGARLSIEDQFGPALEELCATLGHAHRFHWVDCEGLDRRHNVGRGTLVVFDAIPLPGGAAATYLERREWLRLALPTLPIHDPPYPHRLYCPPALPAPLAQWQQLQDLNQAWGVEFYEGVVAKRNDSLYNLQLISPEQHTSQWVKFRWDW
jgi:ATP-dependent DNA ligase